MSRSRTYTALVIRARPSGESNREVWFLTAEEGIIRATVFGGPKSKLRALVSPFHRGRLWIYHDPVRDSRKVSDFDVLAWHPGLRELYDRSAAASAIAETVLAGHGGGGSWIEALTLADKALDALDTADETLCALILARFLWHWADLLGIQPVIDSCVSCAAEAPPDGILWYSSREGGLLCPVCGSDRPGLVKVGPGARRWLAAVENLGSAGLSRYTLDAPSLAQTRAFTTALLTEALGKRLKSWDW